MSYVYLDIMTAILFSLPIPDWPFFLQGIENDVAKFGFTLVHEKKILEEAFLVYKDLKVNNKQSVNTPFIKIQKPKALLLMAHDNYLQFVVQDFLTEHYDDFTFITRRMVLLNSLGIFEANDVWHKEALEFLGMLETLQYSPIPGIDYCYHFRNADALQALDAYEDYKRQIKEPVFLDDLTTQVSEKKIGPIEFGRRLLLLIKNALTYNTPKSEPYNHANKLKTEITKFVRQNKLLDCNLVPSTIMWNYTLSEQQLKRTSSHATQQAKRTKAKEDTRTQASSSTDELATPPKVAQFQHLLNPELFEDILKIQYSDQTEELKLNALQLLKTKAT